MSTLQVNGSSSAPHATEQKLSAKIHLTWLCSWLGGRTLVCQVLRVRMGKQKSGYRSSIPEAKHTVIFGIQGGFREDLVVTIGLPS
jgi:hypothetical protein